METKERDVGHYIKRSDVDVLEAEREEEREIMGNEKGCFRLFGVDLGIKSRDEEERKKKKNDGSFGKTLETVHQHKRKVIQWSREEHQRFLIGLKEKGRGNWKEIATKYVKTRTKSQVASHAQKHFLHLRGRQQNKHRPSVFDMPSEPAVSCQAFTSSSSSSSSPFGEEASTSRQLPMPMKGKVESNNHPCNPHAGPYIAGELPQNMAGFQSFATQRFPSAVMCVPMIILPGPPLSYLRSSHKEFAAAVTNKHPNK